jgi:hypothetical protein
MPSSISTSGARVRGLVEMSRKIQELKERFPKEVGQAIQEELAIEMAESKKRTPVKTGKLRDSHRVMATDYRGNKIIGKIVVGEGLDYGVRVHEDLHAFHPHGQAKFLESTILESARHMSARIARRIRLSVK